MNAPCKQLRSMKGPQCAWSIRRDVRQGLRMLETFPCSCYGALLARGRSSSHLRHIYLCLWLTFVHRVLTSSRSEDLIDMSVECCKRLHFRQITLFVVFFSFILARDTWPIIEELGGDDEVSLGCNILFTEVVKKRSCEANCNLEPDECTV